MKINKNMELSEKQKKLLEFVIDQHGEQVRKYTGEPYWNHVLAVANIIVEYEEDCIEAALCHDLFEDTDCTEEMLAQKLDKLGYSVQRVKLICLQVNELTDEFMSVDYPMFNRGKRKKLEAVRLGNISYKSQSIKYADLIHNTESIVEHDKGFARIYLKEKEFILTQMISGNHMLYNECLESLKKSLMKLNE